MDLNGNIKAPDKIYVSIPTRLRSDSPKYVGIAWSDKGNLTTPQIEEYIRKEVVDECVENCDPTTMKEVSDNVDKMPSNCNWQYTNIKR